MRKITFVISLLMLLNYVTKAADFYWVGNSGNWSDFATHWATTSGGSVFHANAPTQSDNVYFDVNSFTMPLSVVTVDVAAIFNNVNWTGVTNNPDLAGWNQMDIFGSLIFSSGMTASYSGMLSFKSLLPGNTVDFSTVPLSINQIQFDGLGSWSILSDIDISAGFGQISVLSGTVNFNNHIYNLGMFQSWSMGVSRTINMGSSTMNVQNFMLNMPESLTFNAGTSTINISSNWFDGQGLTYYDINFPLQWPANISIQGSNTFHNLGLNYANVTGLVLEAGKIQTINSISLGATCSNRKFIVSSIQGQTTTIKKISGTVHENNLIIQDITVTGGASFITDNGTNMGNVTNWTINAGASGDFYWVGGAGNWSDPDHWSATSGGVYPSGGTCIPSDVDNVFFDANSFSSLGEILSVDVNATCNNMDWTGVANGPQVQNSGGGSLHIFGSLTLESGITYSGPSITFRSNNLGNTITSAGLTLTTDITFEGNGGWQLIDNLNITGSIYLNKGSFNTNNNNLTMNSISSYYANSRTIDLGTSTVTCSSWNLYESANLVVNAGTSEIILTGGYFNGAGKTYYNLTLQSTSSSYIDGSNSFNIINDSGNGDLLFGTGTTNSFINLIASGNCSNLLDIKSNTAGQKATLSLSSGTINVDFANIKDIDAVGGGTFNANNSVDGGNTTGWNYTLLGGTDYYWIGGAGNWSDPAHWSLTSGGVANPGGCIPSQIDNVFFDASSGLNMQAVTINQVASCNNMDWTGSVNARLSGTNSYSLNIYGSFIFNASALYLFNGKIYFKSDNPGNTIDTKGKTIIGTPYFDGSGEWTLQSAFSTQTTVNKYIYFNKGTLNTNNNSITTTNFYSNTQNTRVLNLGSSIINVTSWNIYDGQNMTINPGTSVINYSGSSFYGGNLDYNDVVTSATGSNNIYGSNTYNTLNLSTVSSALFEGGTTQTFTTLLIPNGISCTNYFNLSSATQGTAVNFNMVAGSFTGDWLQITDITAGGGGTFTANNSLGIGDVTGWVINGAAGVDLYWVGGAGSWNDPIHWSLTSGGPSYGCIPTTEDNVFFDSNSFLLPGQTLDINVNAFCKNMDWTGVTNTPSVTGWSSLSVNGSLTLVLDINFMYNGVIKFISSAAGNLIKSATKTITGIELNGTGEYSLSGNLNIGWSSINFNNGTFNTNGFDINMTSDFNSNSSNIRTLNLSTSNITLNNWSITNSTNMTLNAGTSVISLESNSFNFNGGGFTYNDVNLSSPSFGFLMLSGSNTFNNLFINPATEIHFKDGSTQIISNLDAFGNAGFEIILKSDIDGSVANINQTSHEFCGNYLKIQDIVASGTTFYAGDNSTDMGNNSGWTWSGVTAINQYPAGMCEDVFGGGTVAGVNLTLLESTIDGGNGYAHSWFKDYDLTIPVFLPANVTVSNGQAFYDAVDNGTCTNIAEVIYTVYSRPSLSTIVNNVTCNGLSDGAIDLTVTSDNSPFTYLWDNAAVTEDISGIVAGNYIVTVTDFYGCTNTASTVVTEPLLLTASTTSTNISCNGANDGTINLTVSGGTTVYTYLWDDTGSSTTEDLAGLPAGTYNVTVTDAKGCIANSSATITEPVVLSASAISTDVDCNGNANGTANLTVTGGTTPYSFAWDNSATTEDLTGLAPNTYNVTVTDNNGCTATAGVTITEPVALSVSSVITNVTCNGENDGAMDITVTGGVTPYTFNWDNGAVTEDLTGLIAGTYSGTITDSNGCTISGSDVVTEPLLLTASTTSTNISCNGANDGTINLTVSGGTTVYTYLWDDTGSSTTEDLAGLPAGTYNVTVTDAKGCIANSSATITEPVVLSASAISTDVDCNGNANGTANLTVTGGTTPYSFAWDNSATTEDLTGLVPNTYNVTVTDNNGCTSNTSITITEPVALTVSSVITNVTCNGGNDGAIDITVTGGVTPYTFSWDNGAVTEDLTVLIAGTYSGTITDSNGCTISGSDVVTEPLLLTASTTSTNISCNGANDGTINLTVSGGTTVYTYLWDDTGSSTTEDLAGLPAGTYNVTVTDAKGCIANSSATITEPAILSASVIGTNIDCNGNANGSVDLTVTGGVTPYTFSWDNGAVTEDLTGLVADIYNVDVFDNNGCLATSSATITEPAALSVSSVITNVTCNGGNDGAMDITVTGGVTPYTFSWDNGAVTEDLTGLIAGTYSGTITDSNGCTASGSDIVTEPAAMTLSFIVTNTTIPSGNDGTVDLTVVDGQSPFTFLWDGGQVTEDITGLLAGTYNVTVTDNCGDVATGQAVVEDPTYCATNLYNTGCIEGDDIGWFKFNDLENNTMFTSCPGTTGYSDFTNLSTTVAQGGTYNLTIGTSNPQYMQGFGIWIDFNQDADFEDAGEFVWSSPGINMAPDIFMGQITIPVDALPGTTRLRARGLYDAVPNLTQACTNEQYGEIEDYTLNILDCNGLSANTNVITDVTCFGGSDGSITTTISGGTTPYTYLWTDNSTSQDLTSVSAGTYSLVVTDAIGCNATVDATISEPLEINVTSVVTDANCGNADGTATLTITNGTTPYTEDWSGNNPMALLAGSYTVTVTDAQGCTVQHNIVVNNIGTLDAVVTKTDATCFGSNDGTATVSITGGTAPYTENWGALDTTALFAGNYSVVITDANNCEITRLFTISQPSQINIVASVTHVNCNGLSDGTAILTITGGTSPYVTDWGTANPMALSAGTYTVSITDANSCTNTKDIIINQPSDISLTFTPTNLNCFGNNSGSIMMTVSGGTPGYLYDWSGPNGYNNVAKDIVGLEAGSYDVTVTDSHGCESINNVVLTEPTAMSILENLTHVTCNGGNDGIFDITVTGGVSPYTYAWDNGATTEDLTGIVAGTYLGTVTDANGCTASGGDIITEPLAIGITASITDVLCYTGNNGAINITVSGGTSPYTFSWSNTSTTEDLSGLVAGTYDVTVTDNASCTSTASFTVTEPATWTITSILTPVSCNGGNNGAIDVTVSGGTSPFTYSWTGGLTTEDISGLSAGTYQLIITDNNSCTNVHDVTITEPDVISISSTVTNVNCFGENNGSIDITVSGGTTPYTFAWDNSATTEDLTGLYAGTYYATITDANSCTFMFGETISEPLQFNSSVTWTDVTCNGGNDGSINLTLVNGISPFTVQWSNGATTEDVSGLTAGNYTVSITDANGCYTDIYADIAEPIAITVTTTITHENAGSDGAIDIAVLGGTTPYTFQWDDTGNSTTEDITGLVVGIYNVTVTDANGCVMIEGNIVVNNVSCTISAVASGTDLSCNGDNSGSALVVASGGTTPYTYNWTNAETTDAISGLSAGTYNVTVTDNNNCVIVETIVINEPSVISVSSILTNASCFGESNGSIDITVTGGTTPYTFAWDNSATTEDLTGLFAGTYNVTVTDNNGCTFTDSYSITQPLQFNSSVLWTDVTCNGGSDGSINLTLVNGISPFTVQWSNGETTEDVTGLTAGHYTVSITDANGCYTDIYADIAEPVAITATIIASNVDCNGNVNGGADLTVANGVSPYTFLWDDTSNNTTEDLTDVAAGIYNVTVTDNNGCTATANTTITEPDAISVSSTVTNVNCFGENNGAIDVIVSGGTTPYTFVWDNSATTEDLTGLYAGTYYATITDANSCTFMFGETISEPLQFNSSVTWSDVTCNGGNDGSIDLTLVNGISPFAVTWSNGETTEDVSGLTAGHYTVSITDANGCYTDIYADIAEPTAISISLSVTDENVGNDGGIDITVTGGTTPYTFQWDDTGNSTTEDLTNIPAGIYNVTVTDANGCSMIENNIVVNNVSCTLSAVASGTDLSCNGDNSGSALVVASGGTTPYTYNWTNSETTDAISGLSAGTYNVTVTDNNACIAIETVLVSEPVALSSTVNATDVACYGMNNGTADLTVTGGTSPYTFVWDNSQTTEDISGLSGGTYNVTITDFNNCQDFASVTIAEPASPIDTNSIVTDASCFGASDGTIDFIVSGGTTPYTYLWSNGETTEDLSGLSSGAYMVTITDANNCSAQLYSYVDEPAQIINSVTAEICDGDSIMLEGAYQYTAGTYTDILVALNGCDSTVVTELIVHPVYNITETVQICSGSDYVLPNGTTVNTDGTYTSNLNTVFGCDSIIVTNLVTTAQIVNNIALTICEGDSIFAEGSWQYSAGIFHDTTTAVAGCDSIIVTDLTVNPLIMVDLGADDTLCFETADVLTLDAGNAGMSYLWSDGSTAQTFVADAIALGMGTHTIGVTVTDGVCTSTDEIVLIVDICSGITSVNEHLNVSMYPNPTKGKLNIAIEGLNSEATLSIMDVSGRTIINETLSSETTMKQVDLSNLPKGIYAVKVTSGDVVKVSRIVVQ